MFFFSGERYSKRQYTEDEDEKDLLMDLFDILQFKARLSMVHERSRHLRGNSQRGKDRQERLDKLKLMLRGGQSARTTDPW